jgi:hypothetical protein
MHPIILLIILLHLLYCVDPQLYLIIIRVAISSVSTIYHVCVVLTSLPQWACFASWNALCLPIRATLAFLLVRLLPLPYLSTSDPE